MSYSPSFFNALGAKAEFVDMQGIGRYDLLVCDAEEEFEVECKLFTESLGSVIAIEDEIWLGEALHSSIQRNNMKESGVITLELQQRLSDRSPSYWKTVFDDFLTSAVQIRQLSEGTLLFQRELDWERLIATNRAEDVHALIDRKEWPGHYASISRPHQILVFVVRSNRVSLLERRGLETLRKAADQFSKTRPGVIWVRIAGLDENEFEEVAGREANLSKLISARLFLSKKGSHVTNTMFSVGSDGPKSRISRVHGLRGPIRVDDYLVPGRNFVSPCSHLHPPKLLSEPIGDE